MPSEFVTQLVRVNPSAGAHRVAIRAVVSVLVPLLVLWVVGHLEWSIYAAFGAFTSLYGRNHVHLSRTRMQVELAVLLTGAVVLGVAVGLSEHRAWLGVVVCALVAGTGSLLSDAQDWHPPGPLFLVFAFGACSSIPSAPADLLTAALVAGTTAAFAVLVGLAGAAYRNWRHPERSQRTPFRRHGYGAMARRHMLRYVGSVLVAGSLATGLGIGHPYWAMVGAVVPLASRELLPQLVRGAARVVGTAAGLVLSALLLWIAPEGLALIVLVVLLQGAAELLVGRNYALALVVITPLALLVGNLAQPRPASGLLLDRGVETLIGVLVGVAIAWLTRARPGARRHHGHDTD